MEKLPEELFFSKSEYIVDYLTGCIRDGLIRPGSPLPSVNEATRQFGVARKTVVRAYNRMIGQGFIESRPRKGYYVINMKPSQKTRILMVIHSFEGHFEQIYNEFRKAAGESCDVDVFFHHYNIRMLELILLRNMGSYDLFVVSSFDHPRIPSVIGRIPAGKVLVISRNDRLGERYSTIIQDFYNGTYEALVPVKEEIMAFDEFILCFPPGSGHSELLKEGFEKFCNDFSIRYRVISDIQSVEIARRKLFLVIDDCDLIRLLRTNKIRGWIPGSDVGIISYNESPLKEVIRDGITVISGNFKLMALEMADFVNRRNAVHKVVPIQLIRRNSF